MPDRRQLPARSALALAGTCAALALASCSAATGGPSEVATLKPDQADMHSCLPRFGIETADREEARGDGDQLVPAGPERALVCRYYGYPSSVPPGGDTEGRIGQLAAEGAVRSPAAAESLAQLFDGLKTVSDGEYTCPEDDGAALYALFAYRDAPTVRVLVRLSGCRFLGSNATGQGYFMDFALEHRLGGLAPGPQS